MSGKLGKLISEVQIILKEIRNGHNVEELLGIGRSLSQRLEDFMDGNNLISYWSELIRSYHQNPKPVNDCVTLLLRIYRYAGNLCDVLGEILPEVFSQTMFFRVIIDSLLKAFNETSSSNQITVGCIIKIMPADAMRVLSWTLCDPQYSQLRLSLIQILHFPTLLQLLLSLHRIPLISKSSISTEALDSLYSLVGLIVQRMNELSVSPPHPQIPQSLQDPLTKESRIQSYLPFLIQKSSTARMARTFALNILNSDVSWACFQVSSLWSERVFVNQGDFDMQAYATALILSFLQRMTREDLWTPSNQLSTSVDDPATCKHTLMSLLSRGVTVQLDSPTTLTRINGMRIAEKLSEVMTSNEGDLNNADSSGIHFEELKKYCEDAEGYMVLLESVTEVTRENNQRENKEILPGRIGELSDSDSDEEFPSFLMNEKLEMITTQDEQERKQLIETKVREIEAKDESIKFLKYLRECLSSLSQLCFLVLTTSNRITVHR